MDKHGHKNWQIVIAIDELIKVKSIIDKSIIDSNRLTSKDQQELEVKVMKSVLQLFLDVMVGDRNTWCIFTALENSKFSLEIQSSEVVVEVKLFSQN